MKHPETPPNKKTLASRLMRQKIIGVTIDILGNEGYAALTASNLSQKAGISKGALYHHFANLEDVKYAALASLIETFMEASDPSHFATLSDYLSATGEALFAMMAQQPVAIKALYVFVCQAMVDDRLKQQIQQLVDHSLEQYKRAIERFCPDLPAQQLSAAVLVIDAYFGGAVIHRFLLEDDKKCEVSWQMFSRMLLNSLQPAE